MLGTKPATLPDHAPILGHARGAPPTHHILLVQRAVQRGHLVAQEADGGGVREQVGAVLFAARAIARLVGFVPVFAVVLDPFAGYAPCEDVEVVEPPLHGGVVAGAGGVVGEEAGEGRWWV